MEQPNSECERSLEMVLTNVCTSYTFTERELGSIVDLIHLSGLQVKVKVEIKVEPRSRKASSRMLGKLPG